MDGQAIGEAKGILAHIPKARQIAAVPLQYLYPMAHGAGYIETALRIHRQASGLLEGPTDDAAHRPLWAEDLQAIVGRVRHVYRAVTVHPDVVRIEHLARAITPARAHLPAQDAVRPQDHHPVAPQVRHIQLAVMIRQAAGRIEGLAPLLAHPTRARAPTQWDGPSLSLAE